MLRLIVMAAAGGSFIAGLDPAWIAFLGAAFGGAGLKVTEHWLGKNRVKIDDASNIRNELRASVTELKTENAQLEEQVNTWRGKYYAAQEKILLLRGALLRRGIEPPDDTAP